MSTSSSATIHEFETIPSFQRWKAGVAATRWYAVQCQPNREPIAAWHLTNQGFAVFLPFRQKTRRHARRIETVRVPLFPGYLFIRLDLTFDRWSGVNGTVGVVRLVMAGERPSPVQFGVVEALKNACDAHGMLRWRCELTPGQAVRVISGPFADLIGELESLTDSGHSCILLKILGGQTPVLLPVEQVVAVESLL